MPILLLRKLRSRDYLQIEKECIESPLKTFGALGALLDVFGALGALAQTEKECMESPSKIPMALGDLVQTEKRCFESLLNLWGSWSSSTH